MSSAIADLLNTGLTEINVSLNSLQQQQCLAYIELLSRWNKAMNLTAITDPIKMVTHHLLDSLAPLSFLDGKRYLDMGTGAGLPGIPLAIAKPDWHFTLLDSKQKKANFLWQVQQALSLKNITIVTARLEQFVTTEKYDGVLARALADLPQLWQWASPHLHVHGCLYAWKGHVAPDLPLKNIDSEKITTHPLSIPSIDGERNLVIIKK